jgi:hypothetical protein
VELDTNNWQFTKKMGNFIGMKAIMEENMKKQMDFQKANMRLQVRKRPLSRLM